MTTLTGTASRWVWRWCLVYTALAPGERRARRREELLSHLWESERAGRGQREVLMASLRGMTADLTWATSNVVVSTGRSFLTPTPYVFLAAAFPLMGWMVSAFASPPTAQRFELVGALGGGPMLLLALLVWRRRNSGH